MIKENKAYYSHFTDEISGARATVCARLEGSELRYAIAWCSPKDRFVKKHGRDLAFNRVASGECAALLGFYPTMSATPYQVCHHCLSADLMSTTAPAWAPKGTWLGGSFNVNEGSYFLR